MHPYLSVAVSLMAIALSLFVICSAAHYLKVRNWRTAYADKLRSLYLSAYNLDPYSYSDHLYMASSALQQNPNLLYKDPAEVAEREYNRYVSVSHGQFT